MEKHRIPVLYSAEEIDERIEDLAHEISAVMPHELVVVSLLRGSFMFTADLARAMYRIGLQPQIDFMTISSYQGTQSSGAVTIHRDITDHVAGKHVLVVDDILETGRTLSYAVDAMQQRGAADVKICVLLEKPGKLDMQVKADFIGFQIPDKFVIGYGLDYDNNYRELPYIGYLDIH